MIKRLFHPILICVALPFCMIATGVIGLLIMADDFFEERFDE